MIVRALPLPLTPDVVPPPDMRLTPVLPLIPGHPGPADGLTDGPASPQINIFAKLQTQSPKCQIRASHQLFILAQKLL